LYVVQEQEEKMERESKEKEKEKDNKKRMVFATPVETDKVEEDKEIRLPKVKMYIEPRDTQRAKNFEKYRMIEEDLRKIVDGDHPIKTVVPDFRKMTKKQLDDYAKTIFPNDAEKRKLFISESRLACMIQMHKNDKDISKAENLGIGDDVDVEENYT